MFRRFMSCGGVERMVNTEFEEGEIFRAKPFLMVITAVLEIGTLGAGVYLWLTLGFWLILLAMVIPAVSQVYFICRYRLVISPSGLVYRGMIFTRETAWIEMERPSSWLPRSRPARAAGRNLSRYSLAGANGSKSH